MWEEHDDERLDEPHQGRWQGDWRHFHQWEAAGRNDYPARLWLRPAGRHNAPRFDGAGESQVLREAERRPQHVQHSGE